ncbi:hypothetical protein BJ165DRAFT_1531961 [Panaeolus papilionaceus]|nr:hypothetical protein BJ165DRAFT_1531961 [Panaeolus papilionaceus]
MPLPSLSLPILLIPAQTAQTAQIVSSCSTRYKPYKDSSMPRKNKQTPSSPTRRSSRLHGLIVPEAVPLPSSPLTPAPSSPLSSSSSGSSFTTYILPTTVNMPSKYTQVKRPVVKHAPVLTAGELTPAVA